MLCLGRAGLVELPLTLRIRAAQPTMEGDALHPCDDGRLHQSQLQRLQTAGTHDRRYRLPHTEAYAGNPAAFKLAMPATEHTNASTANRTKTTYAQTAIFVLRRRPASTGPTAIRGSAQDDVAPLKVDHAISTPNEITDFNGCRRAFMTGAPMPTLSICDRRNRHPRAAVE